jgi:hypothetical protein
MGGHAALFVAAEDASQVAAIAREERARVEEHHGDFVFLGKLNGWHGTHRIGLGHLLSFA